MRIQKITYHDHELEWRFEPIHFPHNLALLVGVSGVGKTQILKAIRRLKKIANGASLNGIEWKVTFLTRDNLEYCWQGQFETVESLIDDEADEGYRVINEFIYKNKKIIVQRENDEIIFNGNKTPKLSPFKSIVEILSEEEDIAPIQKAFDRVVYSDYLDSDSINLSYIQTLSKPKFTFLETLQESDLPLQYKLAVTYENFPEVFTHIKDQFIDIFNQVEDIKIEPLQEKKVPTLIREFFKSLTPIVYIKEKSVDNWIDQPSISSGMLKTLMHIAELYLLPKNTVVLIDEFENSLGINCLDILTEDLLINNQNLQFIITSHHPYIINNIGMEYWKIVTRRGGVVRVRDADEFNLGKSKHQAFIQLMNLEEFTEGIKV